jgi:hypothetical protein
MVDDPHRLGDAGEDRVALAQRLLRPALLAHVDERDDDPASRGEIDRHRGEGDGEQASVAPDEPVLVAVHGLAGAARVQHRAVLGRVGRSVRVPVVDGVVPVAALQLGCVVEAQRGQGRGVGEHHEAVVVDHPQGQRHTVDDPLQRDVRLDLPGPGVGRARVQQEAPPGQSGPSLRRRPPGPQAGSAQAKWLPTGSRWAFARRGSAAASVRAKASVLASTRRTSSATGVGSSGRTPLAKSVA